ncbi:MAG: hypothetical protein B6D62_01780 [Candidatus Cloacimonas sp. 4484_275]|nr:MAG: hypothetical protein B6D62_01780 [Candidatus Cloacimonas sp. 4484_275]
MTKKISIILILSLISMISLLYSQEKSLERLGNEAEYAGDELYTAKDYLKAVEKYNEALSKFEQAQEKDGIPMEDKIARVLDKLFKSYYFGKDYENAIKIIDRQQKMNPQDSKLAKLKAQIYEKKLKNINKAIETLVAFDTTHATYKIEKKIASYYTKAEDYDNALIWYKKAYEKKKDPTVIKNIASLYLKLGKKAEAVKAYEDFLKTNPKESVLAKTYKNMGALYKDMNETQKMLEYFEKSLALKYDKAINLLLITEYFDLKKYDNSMEKINLLLKHDPNNNDAVYYRALIEYNTGKKQEALKDFQKLANDLKYGKDAKKWIESIQSE